MKRARRWVARGAMGLAGLTVAAMTAMGAGVSVGYDTNKVGLLLKFDDLTLSGDWSSNPVYQAHKKAHLLLQDRGLKFSEGVFAESLLTAQIDPSHAGGYAEWLATNQGVAEIWLHGWYTNAGSGWAEQTYHSGYKTQQAMFFNAQKALIERFGAVFRTWGPHYEGPDGDTGWTFSQDPLIDVWFRYSDGTTGNIMSNAYNWKCVFEPHYYWTNASPSYAAGSFPCVTFDAGDWKQPGSTQCRSLESFRSALGNSKGWWGYTNATNNAAEFVVQGHPHEWDTTSWANFESILNWLTNTEASAVVETRLPSYWARVKSQPGKLIQAPASAPEIVYCRRAGFNDRGVRIHWTPVLEEKNSPNDPDVECPAYIIRRNGTVVGTAAPTIRCLPPSYYNTNYTFLDVSSDYIPNGAEYTVQAVSTMWVLGSNSTPASVTPDLPAFCIDSDSPGKTLTAFKGEPAEGLIYVTQHTTNSSLSLTLLLSGGLADRGWTWIESGTYSNTVSVGQHERVALTYQFYGDRTNLVENSIIVLNNADQSYVTFPIGVTLYNRELHLAPADFQNCDSLIGSGRLATTNSIVSVWRETGLAFPEIWNDAIVLTNQFNADGFSNRADVIVRAKTWPKDETVNSFLASINDTNWARRMVWNAITNGGSSEIATTNLVTSCSGFSSAINLPAPGNYGTSLNLPELTCKFGKGDTSNADRSLMRFSLPTGNSTLYFGFLEPDAALGYVELWSQECWAADTDTAAFIVLQTRATTNGPWTDQLSLSDRCKFPSLYFWAFAEQSGSNWVIYTRWGQSVTGPWSPVPWWTNLVSEHQYFQYKVERN